MKIKKLPEVSNIQGFLRYVDNKKVRYRDWADKKALLPYISVLKANEFEMEVLTGHHRVKDGVEYLADLGVNGIDTRKRNINSTLKR